VISINNISFHFGGRTLYEDASLHIKPKSRIGLIGQNGTGKSTLLRIIDGEYRVDGGEVSMSNEVSIGFLNQDLLSYESDESIVHVAMMAFAEALKIQHELEEVLHQMEHEYTDALLDRMTKLQERFEALDGYSLQAKAEEILEGLGFSTAELQRPLRTFSGGWRMRVMLAKLLLQKPSLLMLDEPTNHLDLPSIKWVESYLQSYEGAIIVVSHDRYFLDRVVTSIVEVSGMQLNLYSGNYSFYEEEKALRSSIQKGAFENQQAKIRQTERFIERFKAKASKARQVQSRVKALEKLDLIDDVVDETARINFKFNFKTQPGRHVLHLDHISKAYGSLQILKSTTARIERGDKIALIGANGKGKSTLLRITAGTESLDGKRELGHNVRMSFYAQHQLESLDVNADMLEELKSSGTDKNEMELRSILGCFLFSNEDVFKKIKVLSGGEKSRVALAKVLISEANFLLLDEPTNHLDYVSVNILIQALQQYEGTYLVVSHDRHFISQIANKIWYIEDQEVKEYPGTYDEYDLWMSRREKEEKANPGSPKSKPDPVQTKEQPAFASQELQKAKKQLEQLELQIQKQEDQLKSIEKELSEQGLKNDRNSLETLSKQHSALQKEVQQLHKNWEELAETIMTLEEGHL
jgi:ATP-binding cassette, subfamily F, member 3